MSIVAPSISTSSESDELVPSKEIRVRLLWKVDELQMLPALAMQALDLARDPDCSVREFTSVIERDMTLASDMLRMANSMVYSRGVPILSLQQAVVRLGFRQCKNLIMASSAASLMTELTELEENVRQALWKHGFLTASVASFLNRAMNLGFQGEEFSAALIHDIGRMLLALLDPRAFSVADPLDFQEGDHDCQQSLLTRERDLLGADHCVLGGWFVEYSGLPPSLAEVARLHHGNAATLSKFPLVALVAAADHMANHLQCGLGPDVYDPATNTAIHCLSQSRAQRQRMMEIVPTVMEDALANSQSN
jgi:HD-like signal output (HDOD) protein